MDGWLDEWIYVDYCWDGLVLKKKKLEIGDVKIDLVNDIERWIACLLVTLLQIVDMLWFSYLVYEKEEDLYSSGIMEQYIRSSRCGCSSHICLPVMKYGSTAHYCLYDLLGCSLELVLAKPIKCWISKFKEWVVSNLSLLSAIIIQVHYVMKNLLIAYFNDWRNPL